MAAELPAPELATVEVASGAVTPPLPAPKSAAPWRSRRETMAALSTRLLDEQRQIQVLRALAWDPSIEERFRAARCRELPVVDQEYWGKVELGFDPQAKALAFEQLAAEIDLQLGEGDDIGAVMLDTALQYRDVVHMLAARGTRAFYGYSRTLYGSPKDRLLDGSVSVRDFGHVAYGLLTRIGASREMAPEERTLDCEQAAEILRERFKTFFRSAVVHVLLDEDLLADATAGTDYVKLRKGAMFSRRDVDVLEVHEGWVHLATSLNGQAQPVARWLSKGPPRTVATQEGLAALMEIVSGRSHIRRALKLNDRILAVDKAEDGASFLDVHEFYRTEGYSEEECFSNARRVFRGGVMEGGAPFTKDVCYGKGLALTWLFLQDAVQTGRLDRLALLFVGKLSLDDIPMIERRTADGTIRRPVFLPPFIRDLHGLAAQIAFGSLLSNGMHGVRGSIGSNGGGVGSEK